MRIFSWILAFCVVLAAGYYIWGYTGKSYSQLQPTVVPVSMMSSGANRQKGNLVAIQPYLTASDFCDRNHFYNVLYPYFKKAQDSGWLQPRTVVVLPENIGSWLAFAEEKTKVYQADSMRQAVATIVNSSIFNFIRYLMYTPADDKIKHAFIYMKAGTMARIYTAVFSDLAAQFKVTIAAGSIILPQPSLDSQGRIRTKKGQLYYSAYLFGSDGQIMSRPVLKRLPEYDSGRPVAATDTNQYILLKTPAGSLAIAASETFHTGSSFPFSAIRQVKAQVFLNGQDKIWNTLWKSKTGFSIPLQAVQAGDDSISLNNFLQDAVNASLLSSQLPKPGAVEGAVVFNGFTGRLWEIPFKNGLSIDYANLAAAPASGPVYHQPVKQQGTILNFWFR